MNPAAEAKPVEDVQGDGRWMSMHKRFLMEAKEREPEVIFIGDSLIANLQHMPIWQQMFEPLHCLNFGVGADQTQHVLWRVQNGELDNVEPKVVVLLVGTNNHGHTSQQVTGGILAIVEHIQITLPQSQLIVMGIPPRGEHPNPLREKIAEINKNLSENLKDKPNTTFLNVDASWFVNTEGLISHNDMYDYLHMTKFGYKQICEPLLEEIQSLLKTFVKVESTSVETQSMSGVLAGDKA